MIDEHRTPSPDGPILLCAGTDPAAAARLAASAASLLAGRRAVVLAAWAPPPLVGPVDAVMDAFYDVHHDLRSAACDAAGSAAQAALDVLQAGGFEATTHVVSDERAPWRVILEVADEVGAALVVAGANEGAPAHPGSLGREARALAHRARLPLLVLPADGAAAGESAPAVFAYDGSAPAGHAIAVAASLLRPRPAVVATVWQTASYAVGVALLAVPDDVARTGADRLDDASRSAASERAGEGAARLTAAGWPCETAALETSRSVASAIIAAADEREAAILVSGTRGRSRIAAALLGSSAEGMLRHADRPVLLVSGPAE